MAVPGSRPHSPGSVNGLPVQTVHDLTRDVAREVMAVLGDDVDPAVTEVADQGRAGGRTPARQRDFHSPGRVERTTEAIRAMRRPLVLNSSTTPRPWPTASLPVLGSALSKVTKMLPFAPVC